jgi:hypothetical protein
VRPIPSHTSPGCPYASAWSALELARAEGASIEWVASEGSFRVSGASQELRERVRQLSGAEAIDIDSPGSLERWRALVSDLGELSPARLAHGRDGVGRIVFLGDPRRQALERMCKASSVAREMLLLTASNLRASTIPWSLWLERKPSEAQRRAWGAVACKFVVTTSRNVYEQAQRDRIPTFVARELEAVALAVEVNRAHACQLDGWLNAKRRGEWRLSHEMTGALDVTGVDERQLLTWSLGRVLDALDIELVSAEMHETKGGQ